MPVGMQAGPAGNLRDISICRVMVPHLAHMAFTQVGQIRYPIRPSCEGVFFI